MIAALGLAAILFGTTSPGSLLTIQATCTYTADNVTYNTQAASHLGVTSPVCSGSNCPVYLAHGYKRVITHKDGTQTTYTDTLANGRKVRFLHRTENGQFEVLEGIQLSDGRVLVNGTPVERTD